MKKKKVMISLITTLLVVIVLLGVAYALLRFKLTGERNQVLRIGDLELKLEETGNTLGLESGEILTDEEGLSLQGFDFTLKNDSTKTVDYTIYLDDVELDSPTDVRVDDKYIKYSLDKNGVKGEVKPLSDTGVNPERVLEQGKIGKNQQNDYTLRIWVTSDVEEDITDQVFKAKIRVEDTLIPNDINIDNNNIVLDLNGKKEEQINLNKEELGEVSYQSKDSSVVDVSSDGLITAVGLGSTEIEVVSGSYKDVIQVKVQKTVEATYVKQGLGVQEIEKESDSCILTTKDEVCEKTLPTITLKSDEYTAVGWNLVKDSEEGQTGSITFQDNVTYYAISYKNEIPYKVLFNGNGNAIDREEKECSLPRSYNDTPQPTSCTVTTPTISVNSNTPAIIGYSTDASTHEKIVGSSEELEVSEENNGITYYAQTKADEKIYHVTYEKTTGVKEIGQETDSCTIKETFNGEVQGTSCTVEAPSITAENNYNAIGWSKSSSGGEEIAVGQTIILLQESNTYYAIAKKLTGNAVKVLLDNYTNTANVQDYDINYDKTNPKVKENKMYVFNHENEKGTQQSDWSSDELKSYRYIGADPNNYVTFNSETAGWRIIGIETVDDGTGKKEKRIKLIRKDFLPVGEDNYISWDNKPSGTGSSESIVASNDWYDSRLMYLLNPNHESEQTGVSGSIYWNRQSGNCPKETGYPVNNQTTTCDFSGVGLLPEARAMIGDAKWFLGGAEYYVITASNWYQQEKGTETCATAGNCTKTRQANWIGRVGLIYPSDYGYATSGGATANRETCLAKELYNWSSSSGGIPECKDNDWLYKSKQLWTITPDPGSRDNSFVVTYNGYVGRSTTCVPFGIQPVVYLKAGVEITGGNGSSSAPFTLDYTPTAVETLLDNYTNDEAIQEFDDSNYNTSDNTVKEKKMYVFNHEAGTQQNGWESWELKDYRYIGVYPNNYVTFNNEVAGWRIIGIETVEDGTGKREKRIKLIRKDPLNTNLDEKFANNFDEISWDNKPSGTGSSESEYGSNDWYDSRLMYLLNPDHEEEKEGVSGSIYWNRQSGNCPYGRENETTACNFNETGLLPEAQAMIGEAKWYLGGLSGSELSSDELDQMNIKYAYSHERGDETCTTLGACTNKRQNSWIGKVGLIYLSDFGFATGGLSGDRERCFNAQISDYTTTTYRNCVYNSWFTTFLTTREDQYFWTLTPYTSSSDMVFGYEFCTVGCNGLNRIRSNAVSEVRPVVYLKADVLYQSGDGSESNPFVFTSNTSDTASSSINITSNKQIVSSSTKVCQEEVSTGTSYNFDIDSTSEIKTGSICTTSNGNIVCTDYNNDINMNSTKSCKSGNTVTSYTKSNDSCSYVYVCDNNNKCSAKREC